MIARCPNAAEHERFLTTAWVMQEWLVDPHGMFLEKVRNLQTIQAPQPDGEWRCADCGAIAVVTSEGRLRSTKAFELISARASAADPDAQGT